MATEPGENHGFIGRRYAMWIGGSVNDGRNRYAGSGSVGTIEWLQNTSGVWNASRMSS